jgi:hypothetical protein
MPDHSWKPANDGVEGETLYLGSLNGITSYEGYVAKFVGTDKWLWFVYHVTDDGERDEIATGRAFTRRNAKREVRREFSDERRRSERLKRTRASVTLYFVGSTPQDALSSPDRRHDTWDSALDTVDYHNREQSNEPWKSYAVEVEIDAHQLVEDG